MYASPVLHVLMWVYLSIGIGGRMSKHSRIYDKYVFAWLSKNEILDLYKYQQYIDIIIHLYNTLHKIE